MCDFKLKFTAPLYDGLPFGEDQVCEITISRNSGAFLDAVKEWWQSLPTELQVDYSQEPFPPHPQKVKSESLDGERVVKYGAASLPGTLIKLALDSGAQIAGVKYLFTYNDDIKIWRNPSFPAFHFQASAHDKQTKLRTFYFEHDTLTGFSQGEYIGAARLVPKCRRPVPSAVTLPLFLDLSQKNITFSLLINGRLQKKIEWRETSGITFYSTPLYDSKMPGADQSITFKYDADREAYSLAEKWPDGKEGTLNITGGDYDKSQSLEDNARNMYAHFVEELYFALTNTGAITAKTDGAEYLFTQVQNQPRLYRAKVRGYIVEGTPLSAHISPDTLWDNIGLIINRRPRIVDSLGISVRNVSFYDKDIRVTVSVGSAAAPGITFADLSGGAGQMLQTRATYDALTFMGFAPEIKFTPAMMPSSDFSKFRDGVWLYDIIRDSVLKHGAANIMRRLNQRKLTDPHSLKKGLTAGDGANYEWTDGIVSFMARLSNFYEAENIIPPVAIMGEAGVGKTTLAEKIGAIIFGRQVKSYTPGDVKGAYLGHTVPKVSQLLFKAAASNQIVFIDEAYGLLSDNFGKEAAGLLLTVLSGDRDELEFETLETFGAEVTGDDGKPVRVKFVCNKSDRDIARFVFKTGEVYKNDIYVGKIFSGRPPIWLGGYENELRMLLHDNQGLYRRFKRCVLEKPTADLLYAVLIRGLDNIRKTLAPGAYETLKKLFADKKDTIIDFFQWGTKPNFSKYFANYAGALRFLEDCRDSGALRADTVTGGAYYVPGDIENLIEASKLEIKRQYNTVRTMSPADSHNAMEQVEVVTDNGTRFADIAGSGRGEFAGAAQYGAEVAFMEDIIAQIVNEPAYDLWRIKRPKGALLEGRPGTGKTFLARALAGELEAAAAADAQKHPDKPPLKVGFLSVSGPELAAKPIEFIGGVFGSAAEYDACVLFIDEVDAIAKRREYNEYYSRFIELLKQMDGIEGEQNIFILAATNAPESLDPAFVRSGRIDKRMCFELPNKNTRNELATAGLAKRLSRVKEFADVGFKEGLKLLAHDLSDKTWGMTPGDIDNIINYGLTNFIKAWDGASATIDQNGSKYKYPQLTVLAEYLFDAAETIVMGERVKPKKASKQTRFTVEKNDGGRSSVCVHEVGHALTTLLTGGSIDKITSLARAKADGYVIPNRQEITKEDYINTIKISLAGRAAEEVVYGAGQVSAGAYSDMRKATAAARYMVERAGFSEEFGLMALSESALQYLDKSVYTCSDATRDKSDTAVNRLLKELYEQTYKMLVSNKKVLLGLAEKLFYAEEMDGTKFEEEYRLSRN